MAINKSYAVISTVTGLFSDEYGDLDNVPVWHIDIRVSGNFFWVPKTYRKMSFGGHGAISRVLITKRLRSFYLHQGESVLDLERAARTYVQVWSEALKERGFSVRLACGTEDLQRVTYHRYTIEWLDNAPSVFVQARLRPTINTLIA